MWTYVGGLLTGILVTAAGTYLQWLKEKKKTQKDILFQVYMLLMELNGQHFWITSRQVQGQEPKPEHTQKFSDTGWRIADLVRQIDNHPLAPAILAAVFSLKFPHESKRSDEIERLLDELGVRVNPLYNAAMKQITRENQTLMMADLDEFFRRKKRILP